MKTYGEKMEIVSISDLHVPVFQRMVQRYEAEFSSITGKIPGRDGFALDTQLDEDHVGYLLYLDGAPAGFNIVGIKLGRSFEVCEFYVVPVFRLRRLGYMLAADGFARHSGAWEVKQIAGADRATDFWRKTIGRYTGGAFEEDAYEDAYWGAVTRQTFRTGHHLV